MSKLNLYPTYYFTPNLPSSLGGAANLHRYLQKKVPDLSRHNTNDWLSGQDSYTLHKPIVNKFPRRLTITSGPKQQVQADLVDVSSHARENNGTKFLLTVVDIFSKYAWIKPLKQKTGKQVAAALTEVFDECNPFYLQTDKGKEFLNREVKDVLEKFNIRHFTSENENIKASIVERFNRSFRNTLHRFFTKSGSYQYLDVLDDLLEAYNSRYHRSIGMAPKEVNESNQLDVYYRLYNPEKGFVDKSPKLKPGDHVRIAKSRTAFQRGYTPNWSVEVFRITQVNPTNPITYCIKDYNDEPVLGTFYERELQKIKEPQRYNIEKIIRKKVVGGKKLAFVKWEGYPDTFNSWIPENDIEDI